MNVTVDHSAWRRRRTVEASAFLARVAGVLATLAFLSGLSGLPPEAHVHPAMRLACVTGIVLMVLANVLAAVNFHQPGDRWYGALGTLQTVCDVIAIGGIVVGIQAYSMQTTWPLLALPVLVAALRRRLPGALIAWLATSLVLVFAAARYGEKSFHHGDVTMAILVNLLIAALGGTLATAYGRQVRELQAIRRQLDHQATHDSLTGLPNRQRLSTYAAELDGRAMAVLLLDLNGFKAVNDTLGHAAGDELLCVVGARLTSHLRSGDLAGRLGGDEFVVVLADASAEEADGLAERLRAAIREPIAVRGQLVSVGVSIGAAHRTQNDLSDFSQLSSAADAAMYREKASR
ncbi:GGDEF domain-containing protein [Paractinoplanes atraurantiacus]|uniref:Diguanylate cyclase (GGDEF) domain-containing protein n=1 Tax=Paractinoplanes atraurantiacus TaxID=1036182 RepID=A0A285ID51_9ACTN|nr:GGDEF domain-containing protein [Actinoplanes atraurantiacus]SNY45908.1 diguanylate cyclase (GGDEF) domain-containing protein [Actinoplanes atraurantiacus]